jgi:crotonobetainyl-CoA:carnitine CoA-transferase CaiB-like acyl-CoA transferase
VERAGELDAAITAWTGSRTADEVVETLRAHQVPVSRINTVADIAADPQFLARDMLVHVADQRLERPLLVPGVVPKLSRTPGRVPHLAQELGASTEAIRRRTEVRGEVSAEPAASEATR